jgi:hypothetical protein
VPAARRRTITARAPQLLQRRGIGPDSAAALLLTAGDNPDRMNSEALQGAGNCGDVAEDASLFTDDADVVTSGAVTLAGQSATGPDHESVPTVVLIKNASRWRVAAFHDTRRQVKSSSECRSPSSQPTRCSWMGTDPRLSADRGVDQERHRGVRLDQRVDALGLDRDLVGYPSGAYRASPDRASATVGGKCPLHRVLLLPAGHERFASGPQPLGDRPGSTAAHRARRGTRSPASRPSPDPPMSSATKVRACSPLSLV